MAERVSPASIECRRACTTGPMSGRAPGAGRGDERLPQRGLHPLAQHLGEDADHAGGDGNGGQHQRLEPFIARVGEDREAVGEQREQHQTDPERRDGDRHELEGRRGRACDAGPTRGGDGDGGGDDDQAEGGQREPDRGLHLRPDRIDDGPAEEERFTEVALRQFADEEDDEQAMGLSRP